MCHQGKGGGKLKTKASPARRLFKVILTPDVGESPRWDRSDSSPSVMTPTDDTCTESCPSPVPSPRALAYSLPAADTLPTPLALGLHDPAWQVPYFSAYGPLPAGRPLFYLLHTYSGTWNSVVTQQILTDG